MSLPAVSLNAWREQGLKLFGYDACAYAFRERPAPEHVPLRPRAVRPVESILPSVLPDPAPSPPPEPRQAEIPILSVVEGEPPRLSRADTAKARRRILSDPDVTPAGKAVARAMFAHQWYGKSHCWPGYERMAEVVGVSVRTIARGTANLIDCGYIDRTRRGRVGHRKGGRRSNQYRLDLDICIGRKPTRNRTGLDDTGADERASVSSVQSGKRRHSNRNTSISPQPLTLTLPEYARAKAEKSKAGSAGKTPAKTMQAPSSECPTCEQPMRSFGPYAWFCFACNLSVRKQDGSVQTYGRNQSASVSTDTDNVASPARQRLRSTRGNPYADRRAGE